MFEIIDFVRFFPLLKRFGHMQLLFLGSAILSIQDIYYKSCLLGQCILDIFNMISDLEQKEKKSIDATLRV